MSGAEAPAAAVSAEPETNPIVMAHCFVTMLNKNGFTAVNGMTALGMALGLFIEGQEGAHRELKPLTDAICEAAQVTFDAIRIGRSREPGHG